MSAEGEQCQLQNVIVSFPWGYICIPIFFDQFSNNEILLVLISHIKLLANKIQLVIKVKLKNAQLN